MTLGGGEIFLTSILVIIGLVGNLKLFLNSAGKEEQIKWNVSVYGTAILILIIGLFTPPDILSNILFSGPLTVLYQLTLRMFGFKMVQRWQEKRTRHKVL